MKGTKERQWEYLQRRKEKRVPRVGRALLSLHHVQPLPPSPLTTFISSPQSTSEGAKVTTLPTFISRRKVRAAEVTLSFWKRSLTNGALGCFHPRPPDHPSHRLALVHPGFAPEERWYRDSRSQLPHNQHSFVGVLPILAR